ncbi:hypothetical protein FRB98_004225 [Tulasnella sp. 332]|nr:hypothetical protein FRB98_004225 [Tulasnella sp. 332]
MQLSPTGAFTELRHDHEQDVDNQYCRNQAPSSLLPAQCRIPTSTKSRSTKFPVILIFDDPYPTDTPGYAASINAKGKNSAAGPTSHMDISSDEVTVWEQFHQKP